MFQEMETGYPNEYSGNQNLDLQRLDEQIADAKSGAATVPDPAASSGVIQATRLAGSKAAPQASTQGEPVSVATGEYVETWRDFLVPATLALDGARFMGLHLALPAGYASPLGPCQISMFDEVFFNPEPGLLDFHQADGERIRFERPFNFLPAHNAGYPHLDLRAPWLKRLELRDRRILKRFSQGADGIYRLDAVEDLNGNRIALRRDQAGVLKRAEGTDGLALQFDNDQQGRRTVITLVGTGGERLELARYRYDARGRMVEADCPFGMSVRYSWDGERDLLLSWHNTTRRSESHFTYDEAGRVTGTRTNGIWNGDRFRYDPEARETAYLPGDDEALGQRFRYDANDNVTAETDALGHTLTRVFDAAGFETAVTDPNGHTLTKAYDTRGNVRRLTDAEGRATTYGWGSRGELDMVIDGAGALRRHAHDERANLVSETDAEGHVTTHERDERGRLLRTRFADGAEESRTYDGFGRLASVTDAGGGTSTFAYDAFGRVVESTDPLGGVTRTDYAAGSGGFATPSALVRPDGVRISRAFTADGVLASVTDGEGRTWRYAYGAFDVLQSVTDPGGGKLTLGYDGEGRVTSVTNQRGAVYLLERDAAGRVAAEVDFDGRRTAYRRDPGGRVVEAVKPDGVRLRYAYDRSDRLTAVRVHAADDVAGLRPLDETHFWYDGRGLLIRASNRAALIAFERDREGRITAETVNGRRVASALDARGRRVERRIGEGEGEAGAGVVRIGHDARGLVSSVGIDGHAPLVFDRDALGREVRRGSASGFRLDQAWDAVGQLLRQSAGQGPSDLDGLTAARAKAGLGTGAQRHYRWDRAGAPVGVDDLIWGATRYGYDANGQVAEACFGDGFTERFSYDAAKNTAGVALEGPGVDANLGALFNWRSTPGGVVQLARGPHGESIALTHDACGRVVERRVERRGFRPQVWRYGWDGHDRLVRCDNPAGETWFYGYDPFGRRLTKVRKLSDRELSWTAQQHPQLVPASARGGTQLWTWPEVPAGADATDSRPPIVGTLFTWDGDVVAEEVPLRLDGAADWDRATRWHFEPGGFVPLAKQTAVGELLPIVVDHLGTPREVFDEGSGLRWAASHTIWGVVRGVRGTPPRADNDDRRAIYPRGVARGGVATAPAQEEMQYDCPIRFQGQWEDRETGFSYNRFRHYYASAGQYVRSDPIRLGGGQRLNGYVTNPLLLSDCVGLASGALQGARLKMQLKAEQAAGARAPVVIRGWTKHIDEQIAGRDKGIGVSRDALQDAFNNPNEIRYSPTQYGPPFQYIGNNATVAVNPDGVATTGWAANRGGIKR